MDFGDETLAAAADLEETLRISRRLDEGFNENRAEPSNSVERFPQSWPAFHWRHTPSRTWASGLHSSVISRK